MGIIRKTKSVEIIRHIFKSNENALSVVELIERTKAQMNKTTVYRILNRLENAGIVHSFSGADGLKWYAKHNQCMSKGANIFPHFQCMQCGTVECLSLEIIPPQLPNKQIEAMEIMLTGICENCLA